VRQLLKGLIHLIFLIKVIKFTRIFLIKIIKFTILVDIAKIPAPKINLTEGLDK
jgi:hypothetical protein